MWNPLPKISMHILSNRTSFDGEITAITMALQQLLLRPMTFKKAVLPVDSKSAIQTIASNRP
jgi:hypothetical protein